MEKLSLYLELIGMLKSVYRDNIKRVKIFRELSFMKEMGYYFYQLVRKSRRGVLLSYVWLGVSSFVLFVHQNSFANIPEELPIILHDKDEVLPSEWKKRFKKVKSLSITVFLSPPISHKKIPSFSVYVNEGVYLSDMGLVFEDKECTGEYTGRGFFHDKKHQQFFELDKAIEWGEEFHIKVYHLPEKKKYYRISVNGEHTDVYLKKGIKSLSVVVNSGELEISSILIQE